jgi:hypothetical protein
VTFVQATLLLALYFHSKGRSGYFWGAIVLGWMDMAISAMLKMALH